MTIERRRKIAAKREQQKDSAGTIVDLQEKRANLRSG
jgi:hypothetical protein